MRMLHFIFAIVSMWPALVLFAGAALFWRASRSKTTARRVLRLAIWVAFTMFWFGFFGTNIWTARFLEGVEKACIYARLNGATEEEVVTVLGKPESREIHDGENDFMLSYAVFPWWSMWHDGYYIGFKGGRAISFMDWE